MCAFHKDQEGFKRYFPNAYDSDIGVSLSLYVHKYLFHVSLGLYVRRYLFHHLTRNAILIKVREFKFDPA
jgi:hypothetical protein